MIAEVLFIDGCPHHLQAGARLQEAAHIAGVDLVVREVRIADALDAEKRGFGGSPSIHVAGRDLFPATQSRDLACRIYATEDGLEGTPSVAQLVEALRERTETR